jgi:hypothetical protein
MPDDSTPQRILTPTKYPVLRIPVFSGGCSGERFSVLHDPAYGKHGLYYAPFGVATEEGLSGQEFLEENNTNVLIHPRPEGMKNYVWSNGLTELIAENLPSGYTMEQVMVLLTGCDNLYKGKKTEAVIGNRKVNVHPAPLYILWHPDTGNVVNVYGMPTDLVKELYMDKGYKRKYTGWGEDIMPRIIDEMTVGASTVHIATKETDHGPCIAVKQKLIEPRHEDNAPLFQNELKEEGDGPTIVAATHMIIRGLETDGVSLLYEGLPLPYQGRILGENWEDALGISRMK